MYERELEVASQLVVELGANMRDNIGLIEEVDIDQKEDRSLITRIDKLNNQLGIQILKQEFPDDGVRGEEGNDLLESDRRKWILDPVDGTFPFTCGIPTSVVLLGLEENGEPLVSCIYNPYVNQLFCAARGMGAFVNNRRVHVSTHSDLFEAPIGTTGPDPSEIVNLARIRFDLAQEKAKVKVLGSTGYETAMVGWGKFAGQIFGGVTRHDVIAGDLFVREAGGASTNKHGNRHNFLEEVDASVMSNGPIQDALLEIVQRNII